jgi:hypothetical protein
MESQGEIVDFEVLRERNTDQGAATLPATNLDIRIVVLGIAENYVAPP